METTLTVPLSEASRLAQQIICDRYPDYRDEAANQAHVEDHDESVAGCVFCLIHRRHHYGKGYQQALVDLALYLIDNPVALAVTR